FLAWGRGRVGGLLSTSRALSLQPVYSCVPQVGGTSILPTLTNGCIDAGGGCPPPLFPSDHRLWS
uniref:Uncharacterized protein n=1 Tax=Capra hircus TaxID=9925 RepID=A0A452F457_CAPHI